MQLNQLIMNRVEPTDIEYYVIIRSKVEHILKRVIVPNGCITSTKLMIIEYRGQERLEQ